MEHPPRRGWFNWLWNFRTFIGTISHSSVGCFPMLLRMWVWGSMASVSMVSVLISSSGVIPLEDLSFLRSIPSRNKMQLVQAWWIHKAFWAWTLHWHPSSTSFRFPSSQKGCVHVEFTNDEGYAYMSIKYTSMGCIASDYSEVNGITCPLSWLVVQYL